jgi:hypothetical protein
LKPILWLAATLPDQFSFTLLNLAEGLTVWEFLSISIWYLVLTNGFMPILSGETNMENSEIINEIDTDGTTRRNVFKMAAGVAIGATAAGMITSRASAGIGGPSNPPMTDALASHSISPVRVYDSRWTSSNSGIPGAKLGRMTRNTSRVIDCAFSRGANGEKLDPNTYAIPTWATAIYFNITVTDCSKANYLCIAPGDQPSQPATSIINFDTGSSIANGSFVSLYTNPGTPSETYQSVKVFCGDDLGSCHVILDVMGYAGPFLIL